MEAAGEALPPSKPLTGPAPPRRSICAPSPRSFHGNSGHVGGGQPQDWTGRGHFFAAAAVAKLRLFAGLSVEDAAEALATSRANAYRQWAYARAWLHARLGEPSSPS